MNTTEHLAREIRVLALKMVHHARASHIGGASSMADILAVLYGAVLRHRPAEPSWPERDRLILSKGHGCSSLYACLALRGYLDAKKLIEEYGADGSVLATHASAHVPGVELSTGSLGHGLSVAVGRAYAGRQRRKGWRVFTILSDGELDEGSNWEGILFAGHHHLDNLVVIVDYNKIQSLGAVRDVLELEPLAEKFRSFRWATIEIDGHNHDAIKTALQGIPWEPGKPSCLIAHTRKGKGVDFMEDKLLWHYRNPDDKQLYQALQQLDKE